MAHAQQMLNTAQTTLELSHFALLFRSERPRNVPRFKTHMQSYCSAHQTLFGSVRVAINYRRNLLKLPRGGGRLYSEGAFRDERLTSGLYQLEYK